MQYKLTTPVTKEMLAPLKAGDTVLLSGTVYTARDAAHQRMMELLDRGEPLPFRSSASFGSSDRDSLHTARQFLVKAK